MFPIKILSLLASPGIIIAGDHVTPPPTPLHPPVQESSISIPHSATRRGAEADSIMMQKGVFEKPGSFLIKPHTHTYL